jgi:hypothetical protein
VPKSLSLHHFCRDDGSFSINNVQEGSYVVEVAHPTLVFNPARVDIRSNGKIRARTVDAVGGPAASRPLRYPLQFKARGRPQYFEKREKWLTEETAQQFLPMVGNYEYVFTLFSAFLGKCQVICLFAIPFCFPGFVHSHNFCYSCRIVTKKF